MLHFVQPTRKGESVLRLRGAGLGPGSTTPKALLADGVPPVPRLVPSLTSPRRPPEELGEEEKRMSKPLAPYNTYLQCADDAVAFYRECRATEAGADRLAILNEDRTDTDGGSLGSDFEDAAMALSDICCDLRGHIRWHLELDADEQSEKKSIASRERKEALVQESGALA